MRVSLSQSECAAVMNSGSPSSSPATSPSVKRGSFRRALLIVAAPVLVIAACALGLIIGVPWLVERELQRYADASPGRSAQIERVSINPFTLSLEVAGAEVRDARARYSLAASRIGLKLNVATLRERRLIVDTLSIEQPRLSYVLPSTIELPNARLDLIRINSLEVSDGEWQLVASTPSGERELSLSRISITAGGLDGRVADPDVPNAQGLFAVRAFDAGGAGLDLDGSLGHGFTRASGRITITGLDIANASSWLGPQFVALSPSGSLDLSGDYVLTSEYDRHAFGAIDARVELRDLRLEPAARLITTTPLVTGSVSATLEHTENEITWHARMQASDARFDLVDERISTPTRFAFSGVAAEFVAGSAEPGRAIDIEGTLLDGGAVSLTVAGPATELNDSSAIKFELQQVPATTLAPYAIQSLGRALAAGHVDLKLDSSLGGERVDGTVEITATELVFDDVRVNAEPSLEELPLELVAALLEDPRGVIEVSLPLASSAERSVGRALTEALRARVASIAAAPFEELGPLVGRDGDSLGAVPFEPAAAGLNDRGLETVNALGNILRERPALGLSVLGGFDPTRDRDALARQQIELHVLLATAGPSAQARPEPVDFASPRVQDVIDEFAGERLRPARVMAIGSRFDFNGDGEVDAPWRMEFYRALVDALAADEEIAGGALARLGRFRAQSIANALAESGISMERIELGLGDVAVGTVNREVNIPIGVQVPSR